MRSRATLNQRLRDTPDTPVPVLIAGGGINGIGLFRDLALQGIPALLVDKGDFASGTSAAPSRLIHGGLRYLETGEFALVRESVVERDHLLMNAPHLLKPVPVWVPGFNWLGGAFKAGLRFFKLTKTPGAKGILVVKLGLMFFDWFGRGTRTMPRHRLVPKAEAHRRWPGLSPKVAAVAEYHDARLVHPERLALELVKDAERDCPDAMALPYVSLVGHEGGRVVLRDEVTGESLAVRPGLVANCAGAWADQVNGKLGITQRLMGGTRGSHLVMRRPDIARQLGDGMFYFETHDFRACFVYALDESLILLGTTDIRDEAPDTARCSDDEISYLFGVLDEVLPGSKARHEEIVFAYTGIRPLPWSGEGATGAISRDHALRPFEVEQSRPFPVLTLVGGKWTTYRACAEQIADAVLLRLGKPRQKSTLHAVIGGAAGFPDSAAARASLAARIAAAAKTGDATGHTLLRRYGTTAEDVAAAIATGPAGALAGSAYLDAEIRWIIRHERVTRLSDIILRRTLVPFEGGVTPTLLEATAAIAAEELGWSAPRKAEELQMVRDILRHKYRVKNI
jgi:glycerol-3-phosphate dehydrogenase